MPDFSGSAWPLIALPSVFYDEMMSLRREAFEPMMESGELVVRYRARRTYSRRTTEATRESPFLPLHVAQRDGTYLHHPNVPTAVWAVSLCMPKPASVPRIDSDPKEMA